MDKERRTLEKQVHWQLDPGCGSGGQCPQSQSQKVRHPMYDPCLEAPCPRLPAFPELHSMEGPKESDIGSNSCLSSGPSKSTEPNSHIFEKLSVRGALSKRYTWNML